MALFDFLNSLGGQTPMSGMNPDMKNYLLQQGLLGAGLGLLQAGAPSTTPQNWAGALGQGLSGFMGGQARGMEQLKSMQPAQPKLITTPQIYQTPKGEWRVGYFDESGNFARDIRKATDKDISGAPQTVVNVGGKKEAEEIGKYYGETFKSTQEVGKFGKEQLANVTELEDALGKISTGKFAPTVLELKKYALALGLPGDVEGISASELFKAGANKMALELRNPAGGAGMPGAMSDKDREFLVASTIGLEKTPEGNKKLLALYKKVAERNVVTSKIAREYLRKNGSMEGFEDYLATWAEKNPLFPQSKKAPTTGGVRRYNPSTGRLE